MKKNDMRLLFALNEKMVKLWKLIELATDPKEIIKLEKQYSYALEKSCIVAENSEMEEVFK